MAGSRLLGAVLGIGICLALVTGLGQRVWAAPAQPSSPSNLEGNLEGKPQALGAGTRPSMDLGAEAYAAGRYSEALERFTEAIPQAPALAYGNRCLVQLKLAHYQEAFIDCTASLRLRPHQTSTQLNLGVACHQLGRYGEAIEQYQKLLSQDRRDYRAYYNQGLSQAALGEAEQALASYGLALKWGISQGQTPIDQAIIYSDRGAVELTLANYPAAVADFSQAIELDPSDAWARFNRGCAYHRSAELAAAIADFSWVIDQGNAQLEAREAAGTALAEGNPMAPIEQLAQAHFNRGLVHAQTGQRQDAVRDLRKAALQFEQAGIEAAAAQSWRLLRRWQADPASALA